MNWIKEITSNNILYEKLLIFLKFYGLSGLEEALQTYINMQQEYICKNKMSVSKISIDEIFYLEIQQHQITIYTYNNSYQKYGSLNNELKSLSKYNFIKCNQSCIVSLRKIRTIHKNKIILTNNAELHMSKRYASKVLLNYSVVCNKYII